MLDFIEFLAKRKIFFLTLLLIFLVGIVYLTTLVKGRDFSGDTAKFQFIGKILGLVHPPGYPTYIVLNHLFVKFFPFGNLAFKANLLSAVFSIFACLFLFRTLILLRIKAFPSLLTTITFAFTPTFWSQSVVAEVYSLHMLFFSSTIYFFLKWHISKKEKFLILGCLFYSLSFGNHLSMITLLPAIFYITLITDKRVFLDIKKILMVSIIIIGGALQYSYIFLRKDSSPYIEMPIENLRAFLWFVTGGWFKSKFFSFSVEEIFLFSLPRFIYYLLKEFIFLIPVLFVGFFKFKREMKIFFLFAISANIFLGLNYDIGDIYVYYLPTYFVLSILLGEGWDFIGERFFKKKTLIKIFCGALILVSFFIINYGHISRLENKEEDIKAKQILTNAESNSLILTTDYRTFQFLLYFLLGEELFREKNIHVEFNNSLEELRIYLCEKFSFYSPFFRKNIPPGRTVYFVKSKYLQVIKKNGWKISKVNDNLYKIVDCGERKLFKRPFFLVEYSLRDTCSFAYHSNRKIDYKIELKEDSETIEIKGKAKILGLNEKITKIFLVLKSDKRSFTFDNLYENDNENFYVRIPRNEIEQDFYRIGIFIKGMEAESLWFTDKFIGVPLHTDAKRERMRRIKKKFREKIGSFKEYLWRVLPGK